MAYEHGIAIDQKYIQGTAARLYRLAKTIKQWDAVLTVSVLAILATTTKLPGDEKTPAGVRRDTALYIKMRDGVQIAAGVWLPQDYQAGQRLPALLRTTRYGRDGQFGWAFRLAVAFKRTDPRDEQTDYLNERHFVREI